MSDKVTVALISNHNWISSQCDLIIKEILCTKFHLKDLRRLNHFLELETNYDCGEILLHQLKYKTNSSSSSLSSSPFDLASSA
uniref:Uncharacterized protein n=1 Tax=Lactuca sativa TaxID=4236 RepID=A0A9R1USZ9_LACSA|nr:hypothetical protein LSAT_V11C800439070 [Lactuca sativa]